MPEQVKELDERLRRVLTVAVRKFLVHPDSKLVDVLGALVYVGAGRLEGDDRVSLDWLARQAQVNAKTVSRWLHRLAALGAVVLVPHPGDKLEVIVDFELVGHILDIAAREEGVVE